jgi:hypothetical protein
MIHDSDGNWYKLDIDDYLNSRAINYDKHRYFLNRKALETLSKPKLSKKLMDVLRKKRVQPGEVN